MRSRGIARWAGADAVPYPEIYTRCSKACDGYGNDLLTYAGEF